MNSKILIAAGIITAGVLLMNKSSGAANHPSWWLPSFPSFPPSWWADSYYGSFILVIEPGYTTPAGHSAWITTEWLQSYLDYGYTVAP